VTSPFRAFGMTPEEQAVDADGIVLDHAFCSWTELPAPDGRMLFVGRGCMLQILRQRLLISPDLRKASTSWTTGVSTRCR